MGVLLQATYKFANGHTVPSPYDGNRRIPWWWDHLASQAHAFRQAGFTAILLPPALKTNAGAFPEADGYGPFDDYDLGSKKQFFSRPTRFGSREQLQRCTAIMRANGLDVYLDIVPHQRDGGNNYTYAYLGADGVSHIGRFPKHPTCFFPNVPRDPIAGPVADDFGFGDELAPINAQPEWLRAAWSHRCSGLADPGARRPGLPHRRHEGPGDRVRPDLSELESHAGKVCRRRVLRRQPGHAQLVGLGALG